MSNVEQKEGVLETTYWIYPLWGGLFLIIGGAVLLIVGILVRFLLGLSAGSDRVFAVEALIAGLVAELVFRRILRRRLVLAPKVEIPLVYIWPVLCLYVFIGRPFE